MTIETLGDIECAVVHIAETSSSHVEKPHDVGSRTQRLIGQRKAITVPGTANALFARVIQDLGYEIVYVTGAGVTNMSLGVPDIGLTTVTEVSETVAAIADVISVPSSW
jgi:2-methylisocitrate lyase-like PEP mutase family enzyme